MCGIVGYCGRAEAAPLLLKGLKRLEYRGYDSAGLAVVNGKGVQVAKDVGTVDRLNGHAGLGGTWGVGHTRWATHGTPTRENAHPHTSCDGHIALVHNGIIENHLALRESLEAKGHAFVSETDSEVVAHLVEDAYNGDLLEAVRAALAAVEGSYAIAAVASDAPDTVVVARNRSPLAVGLGDDATLVASDVTPLLEHTKRVIYLEDGDVARLSPGSVEVYDAVGKPRQAPVTEVAWSVEDAEKGGYEHFMLKEIHEQPRALHEVLRGRVGRMGVTLDLDGDLGDALDRADRVAIVAMGTSHNAGLIARGLVERLARVPVENHLACEFRHGDALLTANTLVVAVSQSGETADTLEAVRRARQAGHRVLALTNVVGSTLTREADATLHLRAGPEISVAATKSFTSQVAAFALLALHLGARKGALTPAELTKLTSEVRALPRVVQQVIEAQASIARIGESVAEHDHAFYLGRHVNLGTALEGALKLKEISYIHAEGYAGGELKHGPLALLTPGVPVVALVAPDDTRAVMLGNVGEVRAREARVVAVAAEDDGEVGKIADDVIPIPPTHPLLFPIPASVALQILAYHAARARGAEIDKPRNLAKSVTVE